MCFFPPIKTLNLGYPKKISRFLDDSWRRGRNGKHIQKISKIKLRKIYFKKFNKFNFFLTIFPLTFF